MIELLDLVAGVKMALFEDTETRDRFLLSRWPQFSPFHEGMTRRGQGWMAALPGDGWLVVTGKDAMRVAWFEPK